MLNEAQKKRFQFLAGMIKESEDLEPGIPEGPAEPAASAFPELDGYKVFTYGVTYETITPESAEDGDAEDRGWELEYTQAPIHEIIEYAQNNGISMPSSSPTVSSHTWWSSVDPDRNFATGEEKYYSLHIKDMTDREAQIIDLAIKGKIYWDDFGEGDPESVWVMSKRG